MHVLLTGANGYIGMRLLPLLIAQGHNVTCCVRDKSRFNAPSEIKRAVTIIEIDFLKEPNTSNFPKKIDVAYYLIHSMTSSTENFDKMEARSAMNFNVYMNHAQTKQVIYLSGIVNNDLLSKHLRSH